MPYGPRAWLLEPTDASQVMALDAMLRRLRSSGARPWSGIIDVVPAACTLMVSAATNDDAADLRAPLLALPPPSPTTAAPGATVGIPVTYDGPDLAAVAVECGLTPAEVVAAHTATPWAVAFGGFAPGFAYLSCGDARLRVSRLTEPRTVVPAGAVALADGYSAIYPQGSPGGWRIIGHTTTIMWDPRGARPALLVPGMHVVFRDAS